MSLMLGEQQGGRHLVALFIYDHLQKRPSNAQKLRAQARQQGV